MAEASAASAERQLKQRAIRRLVIAGTLIGLAVAGLALLERYSSRKEPAAPQAPAGEAPAIADLPPPRPIAPPPDQPMPPGQPTPPGQAAPPSEPSATLPPPPPPTVAAEPPAPAAGPAVPGPRAPAAPAALPEAATAPAAQRPGIKATDKTQSPAKPPVPPRLPPGFVVQLGWFTSVENAQAVQARLEALGIPVFLETRVVAGPFRDRAEAKTAQKKLSAAGVAGAIARRK